MIGERDPALQSSQHDERCQASVEAVRQVLVGHNRKEQLFALTQTLELLYAQPAKIAACDLQIEAVLTQLKQRAVSQIERWSGPGTRPVNRTAGVRGVRGSARNSWRGPHPDPRSLTFAGSQTGWESRTDLSTRPGTKDLLSWPELASHDKISGGKMLPSRTRRANTILYTFYLSGRVGKAKTVTASDTVRRIAVLFYNTLRHGAPYARPRASHYQERVPRSVQPRAKSARFVPQQQVDAASI